MNEKRPVNLALLTLKYPPMAIASILHRISGIVLFLLMPAVLYFLAKSLSSEEAFHETQSLLAQLHWKLLLWAFCAALIYHLLAGIRHMVMDLGFGESLEAGRNSALAVIILTIILTILLGLWIWLAM
ncbi:succinate dehydrogenase, cytochrome b556 subunit [Legionella israelensis]|uniref:Succinate dehydrogenase cytochrome b556 subunit n=1 Tax=Legionella israelensis TaxID=454 RepID=A0A0W0W1P2_9GAMM|nr:succinate dehydrogenase, cytochrome b556 subunit [Legionella israelensis]KTD26094.1 succinate dehydrogenase, cytochrome b556 subunit [Legionella israelensis]QBR84990.1 succinate dehydrogenase, cytochrome b556 subunit [Legionella israelensis]QBS10119.1 succinate dehydrogenase, cytochrome b556 subunit [Legionella israelensis]QDP73518.1 succinate dehydrogenase, cytochrome b556 subunit [Legionella israelensis]SCY07811.1 succinate dehydrogenase subunit C [Legionella israelensis DSM 19235]